LVLGLWPLDTEITTSAWLYREAQDKKTSGAALLNEVLELRKE
jgi:hypothetical protein